MIFLWVFLGLLLLIALAVVVLLFSHVVYDVSYEKDEWLVTARYLFWKSMVWPNEEKRERKRKKRAANRARRIAIAKGNQPPQETEPQTKEETDLLETAFRILDVEQIQGDETFLEGLGIILSTLRAFASPFLKFLKKGKIDRLQVEAVVAGEDAAETALAFGNFFVVWYNIVGVLSHFVQVKWIEPKVIPDYAAQEEKTELKIKFRFHLPLYAYFYFLEAGFTLAETADAAIGRTEYVRPSQKR